MLTVVARMAVDPSRTAEFEILARELWEETHRCEPGCRRYEYVRLPEPGHYLTLMTFDDHDAFLVHQASEHHIRIAGGAMRDLIGAVEIEFGGSVDGAFGVPPAGESGELVLEPGRIEHYAERYPAPDFSGWDR